MISRTDIEGMTDVQDEAPERIWLKFVAGTITKSRNNKPMDDGTEFIRADLARPSQAGDQRVARLVAAATEVVQQLTYSGKVEPKEGRARFAALAAMDTPKGGGQ